MDLTALIETLPYAFDYETEQSNRLVILTEAFEYLKNKNCSNHTMSDTTKSELNVDNITMSEINTQKPGLKMLKEISETLPDGDQQYKAIESFYNGNISYAEMRYRCG